MASNIDWLRALELANLLGIAHLAGYHYASDQIAVPNILKLRDESAIIDQWFCGWDVGRKYGLAMVSGTAAIFGFLAWKARIDTYLSARRRIHGPPNKASAFADRVYVSLSAQPRRSRTPGLHPTSTAFNPQRHSKDTMADSSEESAIEGAGLLQNDASDSENSVDSGSESGSDDIGTVNGLLDIEASESGESDTESDEDSSDFDSDDASILGGGGSGRRRGPRQVFTQFKKLPIELRHRIWHFFCPDLDIHHSPRVLSFQFLCNPKQDVVWEGTVLENQIRPVDVMLAVHHESREIALRAFPDTLVIRQGRRIIHFNKQRDVVQINGFRRPWTHNSSIKGFSENIHNVALEVAHDELIEEAFALLKNLPNLKNVYPIERHNKRRFPHRLRWCASDQIHRYEILQLQKEFNIGEDLHFIYCWPDYQKHGEFAEANVSMNIDEVWDCTAVSAELHDAMQDLFARLKFGRMVCFGWDAADTFDIFLAKHGDDSDGGSSSDDDDSAGSSDDTDVNEYESDGIDDATIDDESVDGEDLEIANDSEDEEDGGASEFAGFSPLRDEDGSMLADAAHFSSPEPEESEEDDAPRRGARNTIVLSEDEEESQESGRGGARRVVLSDDEDEEEEEEPSQTTKRSRRVVLSDDEEDEGEETSRPPRGSGRRARVLPSDDEEDDDEGGVVVNRTETRDDSDTDGGADAKKPLSLAEKLERNRRQNPVSEEEESEEEESNTEEEGEPVRMSLAQRLLAHRRQNPLESESEGDSEGSIDEDDEEDEEDEEEDEEDDDNGMFMNMADEGETDEEQDEEES
ncbi:hypothetical protein C8035_v012299 [Colletotrichum spinosum]|uniref:2EXR domain-containing protein n=1 Tax=Colletotrichum spinosum TaxID=1347390 RepID=A0A4R8Q5M5_9PEZI|nr:hypothetical protein C8035_v012299 [Colletotrichum spinosum]